MTYKIIENYISASKYNIKSPYKMDAQYITIHNTASNASAKNEISYMHRNNNQVSYHVAIDDKEVIIGIPLDRNAWHCGDGKGNGNMKSIGIEICYSTLGGEKYNQAEENAVKFTAKLLYERGWGIERVKTHKYWTEIGFKKGYSKFVKNCPHRILDEGRWDSFLNRVKVELDKLNGKGDTLTVEQYNELKQLINAQAKEIKELKEQLNNQETSPSTWAKESWEFGKTNGITDGTSPRNIITREQVISMLHRFYKFIKK